jgi:hypothetical protein
VTLTQELPRLQNFMGKVLHIQGLVGQVPFELCDVRDAFFQAGE